MPSTLPSLRVWWPALWILRCVALPVSDALEADGYEVIRSPRTHDFALVRGVRAEGGRLDGGADPGGDGTAQLV